MMKHTDCLIIGGGLSGWMAARECTRAGIRVTLLQDGMGASPWVHGFNVPVHPEDSTTLFLEDTLKSGQGLSSPELAEALCGDALQVFQELGLMGLSFNRDREGYQLLRPLGESKPRLVSIGNETGVAVLQALNRELDGKVDVISARALRLCKKNECVCGALIYSGKDKKWEQISAKAVILASGGYCGIFPVSTNKKDSGGDGIGMAYEAGAKLCDMEFIQFEPSASVWPPALNGTSMITTLLHEGAVLRNKDGERFMLKYGADGERVGKDLMARRISTEVSSGHGTEHGGVYFDATGVGREKLERDYSMYVERYRRVGIDLASQWIELGPAPHTSLGGVVIDKNGATSLRGLFACGEVIGGLHGANRIGGNAGLETLVFGRRAGKAAAVYALSADYCYPDEIMPETGKESCAETVQNLRTAMRTQLSECLGAVRCGDKLSRGISEFHSLLNQSESLKGMNSEEAFSILRLRNDLTAALLTAVAALNRTDTLGCHARSDSQQASAENYRISLWKDPDGGMILQKESLSV